MDHGDVPRHHVSQAILAYLGGHPFASDTLRGVRDWWLNTLAPPPTDSDILAALEALEQASLVQRQINPDGTILWAAGDAFGGDG